MASYSKIIPGLIIELPHDQEHHGVILQAIALSKGWYKVVVLCDYEDILILRLKYKEDGEHLFYRCIHHFDTKRIVNTLNERRTYESLDTRAVSRMA